MLQSEAWEFRNRYNLPPTDDRFLSMTPEAIIIDNWTSYLSQRREAIRQKDLRSDKITLDVLLAEDPAKAIAEAMLNEIEGQTPPLPEHEDPDDRETIIDFKAPPR